MRKIRIYVRVLLLLTTVAAVSSCQALMYEDAEMAPDTTVLVYMAADNNLAGNAERDIKEMMKVTYRIIMTKAPATSFSYMRT